MNFPKQVGGSLEERSMTYGMFHPHWTTPTEVRARLEGGYIFDGPVHIEVPSDHDGSGWRPTPGDIMNQRFAWDKDNGLRGTFTMWCGRPVSGTMEIIPRGIRIDMEVPSEILPSREMIAWALHDRIHQALCSG